MNDSLYGYCPKCGAKGIIRERRPNGDDECENRHKYPSRSAIMGSQAPFAGYESFDVCVSAQQKKGKSAESARKICGFLQKRAEGKELDVEEKYFLADEALQSWAAEFLGQNREKS